MGRFPGLVVVCLAATLENPTAQEAVFRAGVDLVTVDVAVIGGDGSPVATLTADDFRLEVDGRARRIVSAQFVSLATQNPTDGDAPATGAIPGTHFTTNQDDAAGRLVVMAVDEAHIRRLEGRVAFEAASRFLDRLDPIDRIAVTSLQRADVVTFSRDRAAARRRLLALSGEAAPIVQTFNVGAIEAMEIADGSRARLADVVLRECGRALTTYLNPARAADDSGGDRDACPEQVEQEARAAAQFARAQARMSVSALEGLVSSLGRLEGPKALVLLSEGLVAEPRYVDFSELAAAAQAARVTIYVLQMEAPVFEAAQTQLSPTWQQDIQLRGDGLARLAGSARGAMFRLVGADPRPFDRIRSELSGHYLLAFEPETADRDGKVHRIGVSLAHGRGVVRSRQAFRVPLARASARAREEELVTLLRGTSPARELPMRAATYTYGEPGSAKVRVVVSAEADVAAGSGDLLVGYVLVDPKGVIAASGASRVASGRHAFSTLVSPGEYMLRVAAIDPMARRGSLARAFAAELQAGDRYQVSDLMLAKPSDSVEAPLEPVVDRLDAVEAVVYLEIYGVDGQAQERLRVRMEIAPAENAPALLTREVDVTHRHGVSTARTQFALGSLRPSTYVARAMVDGGDGSRPTLVVRPFVLVER